jgi:astacin
MKTQHYENNRRQSVTNVSSVIALLLLLSCLVSTVKAQEEGEYVVPVRTKRYARLAHPLIRNTEPVEVTIVNGEVIFQGDISLGTETSLDALQNQAQAFALPGDFWAAARWNNGIVPFVILPGFTGAEKQIIISAMNDIAQSTHVCFQPRQNQAHYIKFKKVTVEQLGYSGGRSKLGKWCDFTNCDGQEIELSNINARIVRHETLHALGVHHEHSREDRNEFVDILWNNIEPGQEGNFQQVPAVSTDFGNYDFRSVMHYRFNTFGRKINGVRQQTIRRRNNASNTNFGGSTLSSRDIAGVNGMYPNEQGCPSLTSTSLAPGELAVGQSKTMNISAKQSHNLTGVFMRDNQKFKFSVASPEWNNGNRETTAAGYGGSPLDLCRRHPDLNMMALVGEIFEQNNRTSYTGTYFRIGMSRTWTATRSGFLVAFANDCLAWPFYEDNSRVVTLTVKRLE